MTTTVSLSPDIFTINRAWRIALGIVAAIALLGMLGYPFGYDQAAFFVGGEMVVKNGAIPYRDLIDTKPPFIFYFYGLASALFGHNTWGIRIFDIIWHVVTALFLYKLIRRYLSESLAFLSTFLSVVHYSLTGYWMTAQAETFAILPTLLVLSLALESEKKILRNAILSGLLLTIIFFLKFTLILFFGGVALALFFSGRLKQGLLYCILTAISFAAFTSLYLLYLNSVGALTPFIQGIEWVREYAALLPLFDTGTITHEFKRRFPEFMLRAYGISLTLTAVLGLGWTFISPRFDQRSKAFLLTFALALAFSLLGVAYERKFFPYHYTRAYIFLSVFIAIGLFVTITYFREHPTKRIALLWLLPAAIFFSPILQFFSQPVGWSYRWITDKNREEAVQDKIMDYFAADQRNTGEYLLSQMSANDQIFFWGNGVGVYYFANRLPTTLALTNTPFITSWTSPEWKNKLISQLTSSNPRFVVVEWGDNREYISGTELDSYQILVKWPELRDIVFTRYREVKRIGHFLIYQRND